MAQVAALRLLVVRGEALRARPGAGRLADRVPEVGREPAALQVEHLVPASGTVQTEPGADRRVGERVLELVAVVEDRLGRERRLQLDVTQPADPGERVGHLPAFRLELRLVREILVAAAAARREVDARRIDPRRAGLENLDRLASAWLRFTFVTRARTRSPGSPRFTKTTNPFSRATPFPP